MNRLTRAAVALAAAAMLAHPHYATDRQAGSVARPRAEEVKEPVTLLSFSIKGYSNDSTTMRSNAPAGQARIGKDPLAPDALRYLSVRVRNDDAARTVSKIEYQLYSTDKTGKVELDHVKLTDRVKVEPGKTSAERLIKYNPGDIKCVARGSADCRLSVRVIRVVYADGSQWVSPVEASKK